MVEISRPSTLQTNTFNTRTKVRDRGVKTDKDLLWQSVRGRQGSSGVVRGRQGSSGSSGVVRGRQGSSGVVREGSSGVVRGRQGSSGVVRGRQGRQGSSGVVRGRQESSGVVRGRQGSSGVVRSRQESSAIEVVRVVRSRQLKLDNCCCHLGEL